MAGINVSATVLASQLSEELLITISQLIAIISAPQLNRYSVDVSI